MFTDMLVPADNTSGVSADKTSMFVGAQEGCGQGRFPPNLPDLFFSTFLDFGKSSGPLGSMVDPYCRFVGKFASMPCLVGVYDGVI